VDSAGVLQTAATDVPRFDHNPLTGESLGLLVEEQRTNLLLRSEEFDNASWTKTQINAFGSGSVVDAIAAPNGSITADLITENTATAGHRVSQDTVSGTVALGTYTTSVYFKSKERTRCYLNYTDNATGEVTATFNLSNQSSSITAGGSWTGSLASIQAVGNNWYRCSLTATKGNSSFALNLRVGIADNSSNISYTGDGTSGIYIWGAQLEAGAFASSYIPTTTAAATRNADVAQITGTNFSSWYRQDEGTLYAETRGVLGSSIIFSVDDGTTSNRIIAGYNAATSIQWRVVAGGVEQLNVNPGGIPATAGDLLRYAHAYRANNFGGAANGASTMAVSSGSVPSVNRINIGSNVNSVGQPNGHIRRFVYWPQALPGQLQAITQP
jgi:hypothetical protein